MAQDKTLFDNENGDHTAIIYLSKKATRYGPPKALFIESLLKRKKQPFPLRCGHAFSGIELRQPPAQSDVPIPSSAANISDMDKVLILSHRGR